MEKRSVKELLEVMLERPELFKLGLCVWRGCLRVEGFISREESMELTYYIANNRPSKYSSLSAWKNRNSGYYWKRGDIAPRIKWIKKHIKRLS